MRIAGQTKLGYYPTPTEQTRLISTWLKTDGGPLGVRLLDPCAGQGEALEGIALAQGGGERFRQGRHGYGLQSPAVASGRHFNHHVRGEIGNGAPVGNVHCIQFTSPVQ